MASSNSTSIENNEILSIEDNSKFTKDSIKLIYSLPSNNFALITDNNNNIYLSKIKNIYEKEISNSSKDFLKYNNQSNNKIIDQMYLSYDLLLNTKYNVKINEKTLERVKNYFR